MTTISSTTIRSRRRSRRPGPRRAASRRVPEGTCWFWSRFAALSSWTSRESSSFCFVTWSRRSSILRRRSSSSCWGFEAKRPPEEGGRPAEPGGDPSCPMAPAYQPASVQPRITIEIQRSPAGRRRVASLGFPPVRMIAKTGTDRARSRVDGGRQPNDAPAVEGSRGCAILFYCVDGIICVDASEVAIDRRRGSTHPLYRQPRAPPSAESR